MATELAKAYVQVIPSADGMTANLTSLISNPATSAGLTGGTLLGNGIMSNMNKVLGAFGISMGITAVISALKSCVSEASEFDASMSQVAATMGTSVDEISELSDFAKEMGRTTAFSANEAAEGLNTLALAGLDAEEQMEVLPTVLNLASAGCLDLDEAASYVTGTIKGFGASMEDSEYYADLMAKGATLANTDVNDLGEALSSAAATANSYGQEADSVTLSLLRLAEQNVTGSEAATALNRAMADLYTPTDAAKGALEELGVSCYDAEGDARDFNDVCDELSTALSGMDAETQNAYKDTIFTTRGLQAFNKMTVSSADTVDEFKEALADCEGSAMQQAETQLDNLQGDVTLFQSAMSGLKIAIGEALTPALRGITQFATTAITGLTNLITGQVNWKESFNSCIDGVISKMGITDWPGLGALMSDGIGGGFSTIVETVPEALSNFVTTIETKISETDWAEVGYNVASAILGGLGNIITDIPGMISTITTNIVDFLKNTDWHQVGYSIMTILLTGIKAIIVDIPRAIWELTAAIIKKVRETNWLELGGQIVKGIINGIINIIPQLGSMIKNFCSGLVDAFKDFFEIGSPSKLMEEQGEYLAEGVVNGISILPDGVSGTLGQVVSNVTSWGSDMETQGGSAASGFLGKITSGLSGLASNINTPLTTALGNAVSWGSGMLSQASSSGSGFVSSMAGGLADLTSRVKSRLDSVSSHATSWGTGLSTSFSSIGGNVIQGMVNGINSKIGTLYESIKSACSGLIDKAKNALGVSSPSTVFRNQVGAMIGEGLALGIDDSVSDVEDSMGRLLSATDTDPFTANGSLSFGASGMASVNNEYNVTQNIYSQAQTAAALMKEARYEARRAVICGV